MLKKNIIFVFAMLITLSTICTKKLPKNLCGMEYVEMMDKRKKTIRSNMVIKLMSKQGFNFPYTQRTKKTNH